MDTLMIRKLLKKFKCFKGVYPLDKLPYNKKLPLNIIINTDPSNMPGEHWVCVCINKSGKGEYFDSFGLPPYKKEIFDFLQKKCVKGWRYNRITLQSMTSSTCGNYCVLYIIFRCQNLPKEKLFCNFNSNTLENDRRMLEIFKNFKKAKNFQ
jgi:hypothetical protein